MEEQAESPEKVEKKKGTRIGLVPGLIIIAVATAVVIFLLLPSHRYSQWEAKQQTAVGVLRMLMSAEEQYRSRWEEYGTLDALGEEQIIASELVQATTAEKARIGYYYTLTLTKDGWSIVAMPAQPGESGMQSYYTDHSGVIRFAPCENRQYPPANATSDPLE